MVEPTLTLVVGAGGLLGKAVVAEARSRDLPLAAPSLPWHDPGATGETLRSTAERLTDERDELDVLWCAGAGVVGTSREELATEVAVFTRFVDDLALRSAGRCATRLFLASSAGGLYAGSTAPPFTEDHEPRPLAPYGEAKLAMERAARAAAGRGGFSLLIGRFANLYGPGQRLDKEQGIVSQLCRAQLTKQPLSIFVSLDTSRDYVYVADAARMVHGGMELLAAAPPGTVVTKILCSGVATTLAELVGTLHWVAKRRPPIVLGLSRNARFQPPDLRFRSTVWPELDRLARTPLPAGIHATLHDVASTRRRPQRSVTAL